MQTRSIDSALLAAITADQRAAGIAAIELPTGALARAGIGVGDLLTMS